MGAVKCIVCNTAENCFDAIQGTFKVKEDSSEVETNDLKMDDLEFVANETEQVLTQQFLSVDQETVRDETLMGFVCSNECLETYERYPTEYADKMVVLFPEDDGDFIMLEVN